MVTLKAGIYNYSFYRLLSRCSHGPKWLDSGKIPLTHAIQTQGREFMSLALI